MIKIKYTEEKYLKQWLTLFNVAGGSLDKFAMDIIEELYNNGDMTKEELKCSGKVFIRGRWDALMPLVSRGIVKESIVVSDFIYSLSSEFRGELSSHKFEVSWDYQKQKV